MQVRKNFPDPKTRQEKLGISWPPYPSGKWTADGVIQAIQKRVKKGQKISPMTVIRENMSLYRACRTKFGSYRKAIETAGLKYKNIAKPVSSCPSHTWTAEKVIKEIRKRHRQGQPLNPGSVSKKHSYLYTSGLSFFGSWAAALQAAKFDPKRFYLNKRMLPYEEA